MEAVSTQKFVRMSPRKLRLVGDAVRGKKVSEAIEVLPFVNKVAATPILKVIKTASANAITKGASRDELLIKSLEVAEGPRLKRFRPVSRGQAHGYVRRMSHIKVVLTDENSKLKAQNSKLQVKTKKLVKKGRNES